MINFLPERTLQFICRALLLIIFTSSFIFASTSSKADSSDSTLDGKMSFININNWRFIQKSDGSSANKAYAAKYPIGTATAIFEDGILWAGKSLKNTADSNTVQLAKSFLQSSLQPGWITTPGTAGTTAQALPPNHPSARIYRFNRDLIKLTVEGLKEEAAIFYDVQPDSVEKQQAEAVFNQYVKDWREWPGNHGAPYYDRNRNGRWDADYDEPGIMDADQVIWYAVNDLDENTADWMLNSKPLGIEMQCTVWAYDEKESFSGQIIFKRLIFINQSGAEIDSLYIGQYADIDIGDYNDDFAGCDTLLQYGYGYTSQNRDEEFDKFNQIPPAAAYVWLQGPVVPFLGNRSIQNFQYVEDSKNLPLSSFGFYGMFEFMDPLYSYSSDYKKALVNWLHGYKPFYSSPLPYTIGSGSNAGNITQFPLSGDPVSGFGDIDGQGSNPEAGDRRCLLSCGPLNMAPGESQEIIIAIVGCRGLDEYDQLKTLAALKIDVQTTHSIYKAMLDFVEPEGPYEYKLPDLFPSRSISFASRFKLMKSYPNPFNSLTKIEYAVKHSVNLKAKIYNVLGQEVWSDNLGTKAEGWQDFEWNGRGSNGTLLPSGIYYLRLSGADHSDTMKLAYVK